MAFTGPRVNVAEGTLTLKTVEGGGEYRPSFPNNPKTRLHLPFCREGSGFFTGFAVSNYSGRPADAAVEALTGHRRSTLF